REAHRVILRLREMLVVDVPRREEPAGTGEPPRLGEATNDHRRERLALGLVAGVHLGSLSSRMTLAWDWPTPYSGSRGMNIAGDQKPSTACARASTSNCST